MRNKERHGCLTAWLIYLIIAYSVSSLGLLFNSKDFSKRLAYITSENVSLVVVSIGILNAMFAFMLLKWVKFGFWGILSTSIILCIVQIIGSNNIFYPIGSMICVLILYAVMKLKKNNVSGWENLD